MAQTKDAAIKIVQAALRSDRDFETYKPQIIQKIKASDDVYIKATVDTVKKYLKDKKKEGFSKLTALMLLKECMDTKNSALVEYVHVKILRRLGLIAQGKDKCLPKDTSDALVKLFSQLLRECIVVWNDWFGYDKKKNPTKYKKTHDAVFAKVEKPTRLTHFVKPEPVEERVLPQSINQSEIKSDPRTPYQNQDMSRPGVNDSMGQDRDRDEQPKKKFEIKPQQDPFVEKMQALMKHIKGNKDMLYEQMAIAEEPDQQGVKMILQNLIKANQQLADNWDELEAKEFPTKDEIADQAVLDNEVIEELVTEYNKVVKKEATMEDYRVFVIKTLSDPTKSGPEGPPQISQKASEVDGDSIKVSRGQASSPVVNNRSSAATPAQVQVQNSQSQSQSQAQKQQDGFDLDAFEEASPEIQAAKRQQAAEEQARAARLAQEKAQREGAPVRDQGVGGPPDRRAPAVGSVGGSQASEGGTRKAPRNFRDLFNNDPKDSRGRKAGVGSKRDKSNLDDSKGSVGFGKSWDVNPQGGVQASRNRNQQQNKAQQGLGIDDFDDLPAADPTGSYDDTSNMSADSRTYDFNYDKSRAHNDKSRSRLDPRDHQVAAQRFSPSGNVLPPNDDFNIRGTRKASPSPGYERASARDVDQALYEAEERYDTGPSYNNRNTQAAAPAARNTNVNVNTSAVNNNNRNLKVDTDSANKRYDQRTTNPNVNNNNNNRPSDGNFGFGNPFGSTDNENNNGYEQHSAGFGNQKNVQQDSKQQPSLQINGVRQETNLNASRRNTPGNNQPPPQQRNQPGPANVMAPTVTGQNPQFNPIERPSFLNRLGTTSTINVSSFEGPAIRQADELLERARRLTSQSRPPSHIDTRPVMRTSVVGGGYPGPSVLDNYQPIPPLFVDPVLRPTMADPLRRSSLERVGPYLSSTFNNTGGAPLVNSAVLNQSSSAAGGDGFLREIERAREASKAIAAKYSSPGSRRQSESLISNLAVAAALQGTQITPNLASAVLQGPSKYTNTESAGVTLNSSMRVETEMRQSHYGSRVKSPRKEDDSVTFVDRGAERQSLRDTGRGGLATERSEKLSRGYGTAKFPEAGEGKEMTRAAQLIEKARRLRDESKHRKTFAAEESEKKEYLYKTPKTELRQSRLEEVNMKESSYLDNNYRREERPMKASQVEARYVNRMEEQVQSQVPQTFYNRYETRGDYNDVGTSAVNIRSRDVQINEYASRGRHNETPVRLMGPDGTVYEEVRQGYGIGRKPTPPRMMEQRTGYGVRESPLTTEMVRGRSRETRHETLGQWRHQQQEYGVGMRDSKVDMKRSAYYEAKELLEASRRQHEVSSHAERRGRFENMSPERIGKTRSPLKARQEQVQEAMELRANESLKIVERPVPGNGARSITRSPAPAGRGSVTAHSLKASLNVVSPPTGNFGIQVREQGKSSSQSQKLANEIKSQLNALKQSLVGRREKTDSASSKATLQLDGSSNSVPQVAVIQRGRGPIIVQHEEVKVREEEPRKLGVRVDNRDMMGQYSSRAANRELQRSAVENRGNEIVSMRVEKRESETTPAMTPYGTEEGFSRRLNVKEISAIQGVKLTMDDSNVWEEESTVRTRTMEDSLRREREYRDLVGPSYNKPKVGRAVHFDYYLFDQITNAVFANGQGKDVDAFKGACLQNKAVLFDSPKLKIDVITRMEDEDGRPGNKLKVILHYANKSSQSITGFNVEILEHGIAQNPRISGNNLAPKYQLKQELYFDFSNFKNLCYTIMISYQHEGFPYSAKVPLPLSVNKFMKMKMMNSGEYKRQWKNLKGGSVKSKYKHINAKFIRDHTEVNKYFDNCLVDVTPALNPKRKRKYGGVFVLPDGSEHYLRITMDTSKIKFAIASNSNTSGSQYADWAVQYLSYLLTV